MSNAIHTDVNAIMQIMDKYESTEKSEVIRALLSILDESTVKKIMENLQKGQYFLTSL